MKRKFAECLHLNYT